MRAALVLLVLLAASAAGGAVRAQAPAEGGVGSALELRGRRVTAVEVAGEARRTTAPRDVGIPVGVRLSRRLLRRAVRRLVQTGRWADVQLDVVPDGEGVRVVARLVPRLLLTRVDIYGNDVIDDDELLRELRLGADAEIERSDLPRLKGALESLYAARGYEAVSIELELRDTDDPARKVLVFRLDEGEPTRILAVVFDGDEPPRIARVRRAMGLGAGDTLAERALDEAVTAGAERLRDRGWLEAALGPARLLRAEGGVIVRVPSHVGPRYSVRPEGFAPLERDDVVDALSLGTERLTRGVAASMAERVVDLYRRRGFADAEAEVRPERAPREGEAILRVIVRPGEQLDVRRRVFPGAAHFEDGFLEEQMASYLDEAISRDSIFEPVDTIVADHTIGDQQRGRWEGRPPLEVDPLRIWYAPAYESAIEHVRELYEADGFLGAQVGPARLRRLGGGRAVVEVPIVEGPRTMLYGVSVRGNEALTLREILEAAELERDQPFSYLALEQAKGRVVRAYQERGFFYAEVESSVRFSGDRTRAELALRVVERYEVRVGDVILRGNRNTSEALLRRVFALEPGDLLTPSGLRETQDRLLDLGVFTSVNAAPQDPELPARVKPLEVTVTERKNQYLDFRAGLSTAQGARFGAEYGYRNLFGTAVGFTLSAQFGYQFFFLDDEVEERFEALSLQDRLERRVTASIAVPYVGLPNVQTSFALTHQRENERNFGLDKNGLDLSFTWRARRWLSATLSTGLENNDVEVLGQESYEELLMQNAGDVRLRNLLRVPEGESTLVASQLGVSLDRRDNPFVPTRGFFAASSVEWARTIKADAIERAGELEQFFSHHLRIQLNATGYVPLDERSRFVFAAQLRMGRVVHLAGDSETYPNRQFFVGGVDTVRGYLQDAMVPQDLADEAEDNPDLNTRAFIQGGDRFMTVRGELRFPIAGDLRGGAFVDLGNLWIDQRLNPLELRPTAGLGLRFGTPVGPIALDYGVILARRDELNEPFGSFHFSIGLF